VQSLTRPTETRSPAGTALMLIRNGRFFCFLLLAALYALFSYWPSWQGYQYPKRNCKVSRLCSPAAPHVGSQGCWGEGEPISSGVGSGIDPKPPMDK
jgi:hypothetical protein